MLFSGMQVNGYNIVFSSVLFWLLSFWKDLFLHFYDLIY